MAIRAKPAQPSRGPRGSACTRRSSTCRALVLLALIQFDKGDLRGLTQTWRSMTSARSGRLGSDRLRRFEAVINVMKLLLERQLTEAVTRLTRHELGLQDPEHD